MASAHAWNICSVEIVNAGKQLMLVMDAEHVEPGSELETDIFLFEQEYFSARLNNSGDSESDENDQNEDECTDDGDSQASPTDLEKYD